MNCAVEEAETGPGKIEGVAGGIPSPDGMDSIAETGNSRFHIWNRVKNCLDAGRTVRLIILELIQFPDKECEIYFLNSGGARILVEFKHTIAT